MKCDDAWTNPYNLPVITTDAPSNYWSVKLQLEL